jgi:hypothetical protein
MHPSALTRLRLAFLALGVLVLAPLTWLLSSVEARLDAQRRLRHEVVADRIFDELERELTSVLAQSSLQARVPRGQRPPVESWPPFVVGYIQRASTGNQLFTRNEGSAVDAARLRLAADGILRKVGPVAGSELAPSNATEPIPAPAPKMRPGLASQSDVLKNLNRAHEQRQQDFGYR